MAPFSHADNVARSDNQMIIDHKPEFAGLSAEQPGMLDVAKTGFGISGRVIVSQQNSPGIKLHRPAENCSRRNHHSNLIAFGKDLLGNDITFSIRKDRHHALFCKVLHGDQKIGKQRSAIPSEPRSHHLFPYPCVEETAHPYQRRDPVLPRGCRLPQLCLRSLGQATDGAELAQKPRSQAFRGLVKRRQEGCQVSQGRPLLRL